MITELTRNNKGQKKMKQIDKLKCNSKTIKIIQRNYFEENNFLTRKM